MKICHIVDNITNTFDFILDVLESALLEVNYKLL